MVHVRKEPYCSSLNHSTMTKPKKKGSTFRSREEPYPIINKPKNPKGNRMRRKTNAEDRELLHSIYSRIKNPDSATRRDIAKTLGWPERSVRIWFQNMRQKDASRAKAGLVSFPPLPDQDAFNVVNELTAHQAQLKHQENDQPMTLHDPTMDSMLMIPKHAPSQVIPTYTNDMMNSTNPLFPNTTIFPLLPPSSSLSSMSSSSCSTFSLPDLSSPYSWNPLFSSLLPTTPSTPFYVSPKDLHPCLPSSECDFMMNTFLNSSFVYPDVSNLASSTSS